MHRLASIPCAPTWDGRLVVVCAGVNARFPFSPPSKTLENRNLGPSASTHCSLYSTPVMPFLNPRFWV